MICLSWAGGTEALDCDGLEAVNESQHNGFAGFQRNVMWPVFWNIQCLHRIGESPLWRACAVWAFVGAIGSAQAQLEEVVVTATKQEASLQDVAVAVSALTEESLNQRGVADTRSSPR